MSGAYEGAVQDLITELVSTKRPTGQVRDVARQHLDVREGGDAHEQHHLRW